MYSKLIFSILMSWTLRMSAAQLTNSTSIDGSENEKLCILDTDGIIRYYGYKPETRKVTTEDGYILTVHCLFNSTALNSSLSPVIAWHGMLATSGIFCINSKDQSLAFVLADKGYYVCLPNTRGNTYSRGHTNSSRNANLTYGSFWKFSWDEIAIYDTPAVIDAVLSWTKKTKVIYIGHSQGATTMFAFLSTKPDYNSKVAIFAAIGSTVFLSHTTIPFYVDASRFKEFFEAFYGFEFLHHTYMKHLLPLLTCTFPTKELCQSILFLIFGYSTHTNESQLPVFVCHAPSEFAWGQFVQYIQHANVDTFQKYDFKSQNQKIYGQSTPPQYDVTKVTAPVALFHSDGDICSVDIDIQKLKFLLGHNCVFEQHLPASLHFNHLDYVLGEDVREIVYNSLIDVIQNY